MFHPSPSPWNLKTTDVHARQQNLVYLMITDYNLNVHRTLKYFFHLNKSLYVFETHCAFLPRLNPNLDFLQAVKGTKSGPHLSHDRASKGHGTIPGLTSQTSLHAHLQRVNTMQISL